MSPSLAPHERLSQGDLNRLSLGDSSPYIHAHEFERRIERCRRLNHDRAEKRPASDSRTALRVLAGMLLCVLGARTGKALVPEYVEQSFGRNARERRKINLHR